MKPQPANNTRTAGDNAVRILLIASAISAIGTVILGLAAEIGTGFWFPEQKSTVAADVDLVFNVITWISIFFLILVTWLTILFAVKYRRRGHSEKATSDVTHNTPLELTWTIIPLILVIGIFYVGMMGYLDLRRAPAGAYEVNVNAQRWSWSFSHRNGCNETNVLKIPVGRPVRLVMTSKDVLHSLFIPAFRVKMDIIPNRNTDLWFECKEQGRYELTCAEYCGKGHSQMQALVEAYDDSQRGADGLTDFERALNQCAEVFKDAPDSKLAELAMEKLYPRCASCHSLDGKDGTGPTWRDLWHHIDEGNVVFTDGTKLADLKGPGKMFETPEDYIRQSILNPQQKVVMNFRPGAMPTFKGQLDERRVLALIELIKHLDEFDNTGKPIKPPEGAPPEGQTTPATQNSTSKPQPH